MKQRPIFTEAEREIVRARRFEPLPSIACALVAAGFPRRSIHALQRLFRRLGLPLPGSLDAIVEQKGLTPERIEALAQAGRSDRSIARELGMHHNAVFLLRRRWGIASGYRTRVETRARIKAARAALEAERLAAPVEQVAAREVERAAFDTLRRMDEPARKIPRTDWSSPLQTFLPDEEAIKALYAGTKYRDEEFAGGDRNGWRLVSLPPTTASPGCATALCAGDRRPGERVSRIAALPERRRA